MWKCIHRVRNGVLPATVHLNADAFSKQGDIGHNALQIFTDLTASDPSMSIYIFQNDKTWQITTAV